MDLTNAYLTPYYEFLSSPIKVESLSDIRRGDLVFVKNRFRSRVIRGYVGNTYFQSDKKTFEIRRSLYFHDDFRSKEEHRTVSIKVDSFLEYIHIYRRHISTMILEEIAHKPPISVVICTNIQIAENIYRGVFICYEGTPFKIDDKHIYFDDNVKIKVSEALPVHNHDFIARDVISPTISIEDIVSCYIIHHNPGIFFPLNPLNSILSIKE